MGKIRGRFRRGYVQKTKRQRKKHISQMTKLDIEIIQEHIRNLRSLYASKHVIEKIKYDNLFFTSDMVVEVIENIDEQHIIEYNITRFRGRNDSRVLLRSDKVYPVSIIDKGVVYCNLCFVLSLDSGELVTVYWNDCNDNHQTINYERYDEQLVVY